MNYKTLLIPPVIVLILITSWLSPLIRPYWDALDLKTFTFLNTWVHHSSFWQCFWAFSGHKSMDWIHDVIICLFFFCGVKRTTKEVTVRNLSELIFSVCFVILILYLVNGFLFSKFIHMHRHSPTVVDLDAFRLGTVIDWIKVKDHSKVSFPGDHATTSMLFACFMFYLRKTRIRCMAIVYAIFLCLPRLVVGAHWLTDDLIGSASIAIIATSLAFGTPFANWMITSIEKQLNRFWRNADGEGLRDL